MEEKKFTVTFSKVTALLCALALLLGIIAFFTSSATAPLASLNMSLTAKKERIADNEGQIAQYRKDISTYEQNKQTAEASLVTAEADVKTADSQVATAQSQLDLAEANLDVVCLKNYYYSWSCTDACQGLHAEVSNQQSVLTKAKNTAEACRDAVSSIKSSIAACDNDITQAENDIKDAEARIQQLKEEISETKVAIAGAWAVLLLKILAILLVACGLALFVKGFYTETVDNFTLYACGGLAVGSVLFLVGGAIQNAVWKNAALLYLLTSPHTWNIVVMALLGTVLLKKTQKPVMLRNIAVVAAVLMFLLAAFSGNALVCMLYAAAILCAAFVIVPLVFTRYICIAKHIFLSLITFGIWQLVWIYHVTKNLNEVSGVECRKPAIELLLCIFLPFYYPYWLYKTAESVEAYGKENGKAFKIDVLCIAFAFVCPLFATVLIQNKINVVTGKPE